MRFLLDECLSQRLVPLLEEAGHDVIHVVDSGLAGGVDDDVLESARTEGRVLVSSDTDFGELLARAGAALPGLILFRQGNRAPGHPGTRASNRDAAGKPRASCWRSGRRCHRRVTNDKTRIRRLPIQN